MKCPFCGQEEDRVIDSRASQDGQVIRRRRECVACERRFTTYERIEEILPLVVKKDGRREAFDRNKILSGLKRACEKRPVSSEDFERIVADIERKMQDSGQKEVPSSLIGEEVMLHLQGLDEVAYVRFASVYREFRDISEFMNELRGLLTERSTQPKARKA